MIYLDNAATSFKKPEIVKTTVIKSMEMLTANPGRSGHNLSNAVSTKIFETRENVKKFFNAENYNVIFTKNCTEALNLAIFGCLKSGDNVITTCYEHNAVLRPLEKLKQQGVDVTIAECDLQEFPKILKTLIKPNTKLVITTAVSNVTGDATDLTAVGEICKENKIKYLVDGAQGCGHEIINLTQNNIDMLAFAGHKGLLALTGVGGLITNTLNLTPLMCGGTGTNSSSLVQPTDSLEGFESGTIPTISIFSLNAGIQYLQKNFAEILKKEENLSKYAYNQLKKLKFLKIYSNDGTKNVISFNVLDYDSSLVADELNNHGICVRSGLHCAPLIHKKLGTINQGAVRISIDFNNTKDEIDYLIKTLHALVNV